VARSSLSNLSIRWALVALAALAVFLGQHFVFVAPSLHDIHSPNGIPVQAHQVITEGQQAFFPIHPSQSLADIRCQVWLQLHRYPCPDEASMSRQLWPGLEQAPNALYVGLLPSCNLNSNPNTLNVEYLDLKKQLVFHCHAAAPWIQLPTCCPGVRATISTPLMLVSAESIPPGGVDVVEEDRVEHWIGDEIYEARLGTVLVVIS